MMSQLALGNVHDQYVMQPAVFRLLYQGIMRTSEPFLISQSHEIKQQT